MLGEVMMAGQQAEAEELKRKLAQQREDAKQAKVGDVWYRFDDKTYASSDPWEEDRWYFNTYIEVTRFVVVRVTPKGVQLAGGRFSWRHPRLQLHDAYKRFACATEELALDSYLRRKEVQRSVYQARADKAKKCAFEARQGRVKYVNDPDKIPLENRRGQITW